jgi:hypothetical protein
VASPHECQQDTAPKHVCSNAYACVGSNDAFIMYVGIYCMYDLYDLGRDLIRGAGRHYQLPKSGHGFRQVLAVAARGQWAGEVGSWKRLLKRVPSF